MTTPKKELPRGVPEDQTPIPGGTDNQAPPPPFGTSRLLEHGGDVPRVCNPLDRVDKTTGLKRFKIGTKNHHPQPVTYIIARNEDEAKKCFLKANGLDKQLERLQKNAGPDQKVEQPDWIVTELPD